jgi:hypothetical protein
MASRLTFIYPIRGRILWPLFPVRLRINWVPEDLF